MSLALVRKVESYVLPRGPEGGLAAEYLPLRIPEIRQQSHVFKSSCET